MTVWKLYESVPITAIITSGTHSSGIVRTYRNPSRTWPLPRGVTGARRICRGSIIRRATSTAR